MPTFSAVELFRPAQTMHRSITAIRLDVFSFWFTPSPLRSFFLLPSDVSLLHPPFNCARVFSNTRLFVISSILGEFSERSRKRSGSSILWERKKRNRPSYRAPRFDPFEELMRREKCYFFSWFCCARGTAGVNEARELVFVPFFLSRGKIFFLS